MTCDCQASCSSPGPLRLTVGDSASWYWNVTTGCPPQSVGDNTWGAEFGIVDARQPSLVLFKAVTNDGTNQIFWSQPGQLTVFLKQATTAAWSSFMLPPRRLNWYLDGVAPTALDPAGFRMPIAKGSMQLLQRGQLPCDEMVYGQRIPSAAGANIDRYCDNAYGNYGWGWPFSPVLL